MAKTKELTPVPPKWLKAEPELLAWAYRHGITTAIWYQERRVLPSHQAYVQADTRLLRFADRVCRAYLRRHPRPASKEAHR